MDGGDKLERISEVSVHLFGYNRKEVNQLVEHKDQQIKKLEQTQAQLLQRIESLEEKVAYYQSIESALKDGLLDARQTGNEIIKQSEEEADKRIHRANEQVLQFKENFIHYSRELTQNGQDLKQRLNAMQTQIITLLEEMQSFVHQADFEAAFPEKQLDRFIDQLNLYEEDELRDLSQNKVNPSHQLSNEEKNELQRLIHEVIQNEAQQRRPREDNLVDFKKAKGLS